MKFWINKNNVQKRYWQHQTKTNTNLKIEHKWNLSAFEKNTTWNIWRHLLFLQNRNNFLGGGKLETRSPRTAHKTSYLLRLEKIMTCIVFRRIVNKWEFPKYTRIGKTKKAENETKRKQCQHQCWTHIHLHSHIIHALLLGTQRNFKRWHQPLDHGDGNLFHISPKSFAKTAISTNWGKIHSEVCRPAGRQSSNSTWHPLKTLLLWALHSAYY